VVRRLRRMQYDVSLWTGSRAHLPDSPDDGQ
jgi:hypothetical protein